MKIENIAAQMYTLRNYTKNEEDIYKSLKKVSEIGYKAVQFSGMAKIDIKLLKSMLDEFSLKACATHIPFDRLKEDLNGVINEHHILECKHIAIPSAPNEYRNEEGFKALANECNEIGKKLKSEGITLSYHNHSFEFKKYHNKTGLEILFENSNPEYLYAEIDTYWVQFGGANVEKWIKKYKDRMSIIHLKDMEMIDEKQQTMSEIGNGNLDWEGIIKACEEADIEWYIIEQDICQRNPFDSLKISLEYLIKNYVK